MSITKTDIAVVGAGLTGILCAQLLKTAGFSVVVVEKSRGLGGRVATRRLPESCADHGARFLQDQGDYSRQFIQALSDRQIIYPWINQIYQLQPDGSLQSSPLSQPGYAAPTGLTAIAKTLATGLDVWRSRRVIAMTANSSQGWTLTLDAMPDSDQITLAAKAVILAIPAPQAVTLLEPLIATGLSTDWLAQLQQVTFDPCITAIATYPAQYQADLAKIPWSAVTSPNHPLLDWVSLETRKRSLGEVASPEHPIVVIQSNAAFAHEHLDAKDLNPVGQILLDAAAKILLPWLDQPEVLQVHRWRYAFVNQALEQPCLSTKNPQPLVCGGDWCGYQQIESALKSGEAIANQMCQLLKPETSQDGTLCFDQWLRSHVELN